MDANIFMYAAGAAHPYKAPRTAFLLRVAPKLDTTQSKGVRKDGPYHLRSLIASSASRSRVFVRSVWRLS
jgi:hypothetical protein